MRYNYDKLKGRIVEKCGSQKNFAKQMGCSERTISLKLNNEIQFKQDEIVKISNVLGLTIRDIPAYFFCE